ncbi:fungal-specific transcription factor domain-containing protein [Xylariaceae sp. FL0662B]|nr:fungal-specific transcription factor domain-containing protein [Xylariaceae sp. FL0662B]
MPKKVGSRQQPGYACEECRKKKLRCDRKRPQCGACANAHITCKAVNRRASREPKQGSNNALHIRIAGFDERLRTMQQDNSLVQGSEPADDFTISDLGLFERVGSEESLQQDEFNSTLPLHLGSGCLSPFAFLSGQLAHGSLPQSSPDQPPIPQDGLVISDYVKADLTQLYFDRVHPVVPMLNRARTLSWTKDADLANEYPLCLQHAMWTLAMAFSSQFDHLRDEMYSKTRASLESLDQKDGDAGICHTEHVQAWILITYYEFMKINYRRGWLSSGHVFRLVQLSRLYSVDKPKLAGASDAVAEDLIAVEEKRRTFWVAYCLDRFLTVANGASMMLGEEENLTTKVCTRLPCLDDDFQCGLIKEECFLSEALTLCDMRAHSSLAECTMLVTICGRAQSHQALWAIENMYGRPQGDVDMRHDWLDNMLSQRLQNLQANYPLASSSSDPMITFAYMVAQSTIIYFCHITRSLSSNITLGALNSALTRQNQLQERALWAAQEISRLARDHEYLYFKAHTFMPLAIFLGAAKLKSYLQDAKEMSLNVRREAVEKSLQASLEALGKLKKLNELAGHYLKILESESVSELGWSMG